MRLFIAVNLSESCRQLLQNKVNKIKKAVSEDVKWVKPQNWHLTLKFLGEVNKTKLPDIKEVIKKTGTKYENFPVKFRGIGAFPEIGYPRVFFIKIADGQAPLININENLEMQLKPLGFEAENREYIPHLTVARSKDETNLKNFSQSIKKFNERYFINVYMEVSEISLMESKLFPEGPVYEKISQVSL